MQQVDGAVDSPDAATKDDATGAKEGKFLTFSLGGEEYGLELRRVREIIAMIDITPVPNTPSYIRGVMNLRGQIIPVIDLRLKFGMERTPDNDRKCIIVVDVGRGAKSTMSSILVDSVSEVLFISGDEIIDPSTFDIGTETDFIQGVANTDNQEEEDGSNSGIKILLDIDNVIAVETIDAVAVGAVADNE